MASISALNPSLKESAETTPNIQETTPLRTGSNPTKTKRFEDVENLKPDGPRNTLYQTFDTFGIYDSIKTKTAKKMFFVCKNMVFD